jgi:NitT/TauT family transport system substrate-binding protein
MNTGRRSLLALAASAPLMGMLGCQRPPDTVRVASNSWVGYAPLFLAHELGHLQEPLLRLVQMPSNSASLMALAAGQVEAAALTLDELLVARQGGLDLQVILVFDESAGADVVMVRPGITRLEQLSGQRIAVESTATGALMLSHTLQVAGLAPSDITQVELAGPRQIDAYARQQVDAVVCFEPYATQLARLGARRLIDSRQFPGLIVDVLVANRAAAQDRPQHFMPLLAGCFKALALMQTNPSLALQKLAPTLGLSEHELNQALQGVRMKTLADNHRLLGGTAPALLTVAATLSQEMLSAKLLHTAVPMDHLVTSRFLPST